MTSRRLGLTLNNQPLSAPQFTSTADEDVHGRCHNARFGDGQDDVVQGTELRASVDQRRIGQFVRDAVEEAER